MRKCASNVSIFLEFLPRYKEYLYQCITRFKAGCLSLHISAWEEITSDEEVLQTVQGMKLEFEESPLAMLRMQGYTVAIYIDDIIAIDQSFEECLLTVVETINLFQKLGFVIHSHKSKFIPAKIVEYPGFIIDPEKMITYLSDQKKQKNYEKCRIIPTKPKLTIRKYASFIGTLTSSFPGNQFVPLHYRAMLKLKDKSLKYNKGNFNAVIKLSEDTLHMKYHGGKRIYSKTYKIP